LSSTPENVVHRTRDRGRLQTEIAGFVREYARKAPRHGEPNDRGYDRKMEDQVKRMNPLDLSALMHGDEEAE
jgi:hypothetical protein